MRKLAVAVVVRNAARVKGGVGRPLGVLGPGKICGAVGVELATLPLTATAAKDVELPVRAVGGRRGKHRVGGASIRRGGSAGSDVSLAQSRRMIWRRDSLGPARGDCRLVAIGPANG